MFILAWTLFMFVFYLPYLLTMSPLFVFRRVRRSVGELEGLANECKRVALRAITKHGKPKRDVERELNSFLEFFTIAPVSEDPAGVLRRLEHLLDVRKKRFEGVVSHLAPKAGPEAAANLEMTLEGAMASYTVYRLVRHFALLAEKTKSPYLAMQIQMVMPFLREYARAFTTATKTFAEGKPIGDGMGAMVVAKLIGNTPCHELVEDTVYAEKKFEGRKLLLVKAKGPGGRVGKPGELIKRLVERRRVDRIIMIDAGLKLEGDVSGQVIEGVGAAIGGPPVDKYKIEQVAVKHKIPVDAILIKESFKEAIGPLNRRLAKSADETVERVKRAIRQRTKPGDVVIVAGIGNTIGIGQRTSDLPKEFPEGERGEREIESDLLPFR